MAFDLNNFLVDRIRRGTMFSDTTGEALWSITQINDATLSMTSETADVVDAIGNIITQFDRSKNAEFSGTNALWDLGLSAAQFGSDKQVATSGKKITVPVYEQLTVDADSHSITLSHEPYSIAGNNTGVKFVYELKPDSTLGLQYSLTDSEPSSGKFTLDGETITFDEGVKSGTFAVFYEYQSDNAIMIQNNASEFPKAGRFVLEVIGKDTCDKTAVYVANIVFPNAKLKTDMDLSFTTDGGHPFSMQMMQDYCDFEKRLFTIYVDGVGIGSSSGIQPQPQPPAEETKIRLMGQDEMPLGDKVKVSDMISPDTKILSGGIVSGTLKKVDNFDAFSSDPSERTGHYFPIKLDSAYENKNIKCTGTNSKVAQDTEWVLLVKDNKSTFKFEVNDDSTEIVTLKFTQATFAS